MVGIKIKKDELCLEDHITIYSKNAHPETVREGAIEAPDVEIRLVFKDGRFDYMQCSTLARQGSSSTKASQKQSPTEGEVGQ